MSSRFSLQNTWHYFLISLICLAMIGVIAYIHLIHFFTIKALSCFVDTQPCPDYIQAEWQKSSYKSIFFTDLNGQGQRILYLMPSLSSLRVKKTLPDKVDILFTAAQPSYQLQSGQQFFTVDTTGVIVDETATASGLPIAQVNQAQLPELQVHQKLDDSLHQHLQKMFTQLQQHPLDYQTINLDNPDEISIHLRDGRTATLRVADAEVAIQKLMFVLGSVDFASFHQPITVIDVRFKYPVLHG